jgi:hypothetical protein
MVVMAGCVRATADFSWMPQDVDGRVKPGHDDRSRNGTVILRSGLLGPRLEGWCSAQCARPTFEARKKVRAPHGRTLRVRPGDDGVCVEMSATDLPDGQISSVFSEVCVQPLLQKYFCFLRGQIICLLDLSRAP